MTVRELVLKLTELDPNLEVMIPDKECIHIEVEDVEEVTDGRQDYVVLMP